MLEYKGYIAAVEFDDSIMALHGHVVNIRDTVTFEAKNATSVEKEFRKSVDEYLKYCKEKKLKPEKPFSGEFRLRLGTELHRKVSLRAASKGQSLNNYIKEALQDVVAE